MSKPLDGEVYYCGYCNRQFDAKPNEIMCNCGNRRVSWYTKTEKEEDAKRKWKNANGKR